MGEKWGKGERRKVNHCLVAICICRLRLYTRMTSIFDQAHG